MATQITDHDKTSKSQPFAYGYLRMAEPDEAEIARLRQALGAYCHQHGYRLVTIFCDRDIRATEHARPGFTGLLDAASAVVAEQIVVLVPDYKHLSTDDLLREGLERAIRRTGAELLIMNGVNGRQHERGRRAC